MCAALGMLGWDTQEGPRRWVEKEVGRRREEKKTKPGFRRQAAGHEGKCSGGSRIPNQIFEGLGRGKVFEHFKTLSKKQ